MRIATRVADIDMQLVCDDPDVYKRLCHRFQGFPGSATSCSDARSAGHCATVRIEGELPAAPPEFDITIHDDEFELGYRIGGPSVLILRDTESSHDALDLHLHSALLHLFSLALIDDEKLLLHAGAVSYANSTSLFVGRSGAGKSTLAAMFPSECVLNDEFVAVSADGCQVYATPFYGTSMSERSGKPRSETIDRFLTLRHTTRPVLRRVSDSDAARALLASAVVPSTATGYRQRVFEHGFGFGRAPWLELGFSEDRSQTLEFFEREFSGSS